MGRMGQPLHIHQVSTQSAPVLSATEARRLDGPTARAFIRLQRFNARLERHCEALRDWRRAADERRARQLATAELLESQEVAGMGPPEPGKSKL